MTFLEMNFITLATHLNHQRVPFFFFPHICPTRCPPGHAPVCSTRVLFHVHASCLRSLQVATVSERSRIMELEREVADLQLRLRASQQKEDAVSLSQQQISSLKAQAQCQEKRVCWNHEG